MKSILLLCVSTCISYLAMSQFVGIGTTVPAADLHVNNNTGNAEIRVSGSSSYLNLLVPGGIGFNRLEIYKHGLSASGTQAGIPLANLSKVVAGADAGQLLLGTVTNSEIYFMTNNLERMRIKPAGNVHINNTTAGSLGWLHVESTDATPPLYVSNSFGGGKAIYSSGALQFTNIGESSGRVLGTDNAGNATWQALPAGSTAWTVFGSNIYNTALGRVGIASVFAPEAWLEIVQTSTVGVPQFQLYEPNTTNYSRQRFKNNTGKYFDLAAY